MTHYNSQPPRAEIYLRANKCMNGDVDVADSRRWVCYVPACLVCVCVCVHTYCDMQQQPRRGGIMCQQNDLRVSIRIFGHGPDW